MMDLQRSRLQTIIARTPEQARSLRRLPDMGERVINGMVWTKFRDTKEYKVSPQGASGDYDKDAYFLSYDEVQG